MSDPQHTPGPWCVEVYDTIEEAAEACGFRWAGGEWDAAKLGRPASVWQRLGGGNTGLPGSIECGEANARLIAAAPDLLAACKAARSFGSQGDTDEGISVSWLLDAAIARATGTPEVAVTEDDGEPDAFCDLDPADLPRF